MNEEEIRNLKDPLFVNYNLLLKLEEIKNILIANFEINQAILEQKRPKDKEKQDEK